jgi:post-segregation antitoxin (ccd killing protein)
MNAYSTRGQARIRQSDLANLMEANLLSASHALRALEWRRGREAEAEMAWLLKQHGVKPPSAASRVLAFRQVVGAALVRAGERLAGESRAESTREPVPTAGAAG